MQDIAGPNLRVNPCASRLPCEDADAGEDERAADGKLRREGLVQQPEGQQERDDDAAFVHEGDEGDGAGLHRAVVEDPRERGGKAGKGQQDEVARSRGFECGDGAGTGPDERIEQDEGEDDAGAEREAHVGAEVFHAGLGEHGGEPGEEGGEEGLDFPGFHGV